MRKINIGAASLAILLASVLTLFAVPSGAQVVEKGRTLADLIQSHPCDTGLTNRIARVTDCDAADDFGNGGGAFQCWAYCDGSAPWTNLSIGGGGGGGTIGGTLGATDNAVIRADGTGTVTAQGSLVTISDSGAMSINSTDAGQATLGSELLTNNSFTSDLSSWTAGANWAYNSGGALHTAGSTATLAKNVTVTSGSSYQVAFTISGRTAGTIAISLGAVSLNEGGTTSWSATKAGIGIVAAATGAVSFAITPTTDFDGKIDDVSIKLITVSSSIFTVQSSSAAFSELRGSASLSNLFLGVAAGRSTSTGAGNVAMGTYALMKNTTGGYNAAYGWSALLTNTTGVNNAAYGNSALYYNTTGSNNVAHGYFALYSNTTGVYNSAFGATALSFNTTGSYNVAAGHFAGRYIADGTTANETSGTSTFLGAMTRASADGVANETAIGYLAIGSGSNTVALGNTSVTGVTTTAGIYAIRAAASTIASAGTIAPTKGITFVSGTTTISTITAPSLISAGGGQITLIPTGLWSTNTAGNIAIATTAVVSKALIMTYDSGTAKWYPSY